MKSRIHSVIVSVKFDKPVTAGSAVWLVQENIHGDFWPTAYSEDQPEKFTVRSVRPLPRNPRTRPRA